MRVGSRTEERVRIDSALCRKTPCLTDAVVEIVRSQKRRGGAALQNDHAGIGRYGFVAACFFAEKGLQRRDTLGAGPRALGRRNAEKWRGRFGVGGLSWGGIYRLPGYEGAARQRAVEGAVGGYPEAEYGFVGASGRAGEREFGFVGGKREIEGADSAQEGGEVGEGREEAETCAEQQLACEHSARRVHQIFSSHEHFD